MQMNCWYCWKHKSLLVCRAGRPLYEAYSNACKRYYQVTVVEGRHAEDNDPVFYEAWLTLSVTMRAYYNHEYQQA